MKVKPVKPRGTFTLSTGEIIKIGPSAVKHTKGVSHAKLFRELHKASKENLLTSYE